MPVNMKALTRIRAERHAHDLAGGEEPHCRLEPVMLDRDHRRPIQAMADEQQIAEPTADSRRFGKPGHRPRQLTPPLRQDRLPDEAVGDADLIACGLAHSQQLLVQLGCPVVLPPRQRRPRQQPKRAVATELLGNRLTRRQGFFVAGQCQVEIAAEDGDIPLVQARVRQRPGVARGPR